MELQLQDDFRELLESFHSTGVAYVVVGGFALAAHGAPRATGDLDLLLRADPENAARVVQALKAFGLGGLGLTTADLEALAATPRPAPRKKR